MWRAVGRLILVPLGFVLATAACLTVLLTLGLERFTHALAKQAGDVAWWSVMFDFALNSLSVIAALSIIPAVLLVVVGEVARIRSATYYIVGGGAAMAVLPLAAGSSARELLDFASGWPIFATAGFAGGLVYWLVAGRST